MKESLKERGHNPGFGPRNTPPDLATSLSKPPELDSVSGGFDNGTTISGYSPPSIIGEEWSGSLVDLEVSFLGESCSFTNRDSIKY